MIVESGPLGCGSPILLNLSGIQLEKFKRAITEGVYFVSMNDSLSKGAITNSIVHVNNFEDKNF